MLVGRRQADGLPVVDVLIVVIVDLVVPEFLELAEVDVERTGIGVTRHADDLCVVLV